MKSRVSKLVSVLCVVSMLASALPVSVFAADVDEHDHGAEGCAYVNGAYVCNPDTAPKGEIGPMRNAALFAAPRAADPNYIHNFTTDGKTTSGIYTNITGNLSKDKGTVTYNGLTLTQCLKMESSTKIALNAPESGTLTLVFGGSTNAAGKKVKIGGVAKTIGSDSILTVDVSAGNVEVTKGDPINLFYMEFAGSCPGHTYDKGDTKVLTNPTCTTAGEGVKLCDNCGAEGEKYIIPALGHDWGAYTTTRAATCVLEGEETAKCTRCDATDSKPIAKIAHDFTGSDTTHCSMCGVKQGVDLDTHTHNWGEWTDVSGKTANCTTAGEQTHQCPDCEMTETKIIPALGHDWPTEWTTDKAASCTEEGQRSRTCKRVGCNEKQTEAVAKLPHKVGADGVCSVCHQAIGNALQGAGGWLESMYVETDQFSAADVTDVSWTGPVSDSFGPGNRGQYDMDFLVRTVGGKTRIDIPGLKMGTYNLTVTTADGQRYTAEGVEVKPHDRSGYAHWNYTEGVGAYRDDGILKENAIVIYVNEQNKNTVELEIPGVVSVQGIGNILNSVGQESSENPGYCKRTSGGKTYWGIANTNQNVLKLLADRNIPLVVRIVGDVKSFHPAPKAGGIDGLTAYDSWDYGGSEGDNGGMARAKDCKDITIEGIGPDACMNGWGLHFMASGATPNYGKNFEVRNITFRNVPEDCIGMEGIQEGSTITAPILHGWVHNCSFYAPSISPCAESDKSGGDGACDFKRGEFFTMDYCYYEGYHKTNLVGSSDTSLQYNITWHHNHYVNCESRGPLGRQANMHIYNCIYEGQTSYAMNPRANCYIVSEYNSFINCKNPMTIKLGAIKSYNDVFSGCIEDMQGTIVDSMDTPVASNNVNKGFELDKTKGYIASLDYKLDRSVGEARQNILANAGAMKAKVVEPEEIEPTVVQPNRKPTNPVVLPYDKDINSTNAVTSGTKDNIVFNVSKVDNMATFGKDTIGQYIVFMVDKTVDITMTPGGSSLISLVNQDGLTVAQNSETAKNCPPGIYFIQPSSQSKGIFKEGKLSHLKITEVAGASTHEHKYTVDAGIVVQPTCIKEGSRKWKCTDCDLFITRSIPMTEHTDSDSDGLCDDCGFNMNNVGPIDPGERVEVTGLTVTPKALKLQQGEQGRIIATVSPTNATNKSVAYSSSNTKVASVGTSGYVSANTPGTAVITVKASNNFTETVNVTVTGVDTKTYTFNAVDQGQQSADNNPAAEGTKVGTENFFAVTGANAVWRTKNKNTDKTTASLQIGAKRGSGMTFTIPAGSTAQDVTISFGSTSSSNTSAVVLVDASGNRMVDSEGRTMNYVTGTSGGKATYKNLPAGTYTIYAPKDVTPSEVGLENWADPSNTSDPSNPNLRGARITTVTVVRATSTDTTYQPVTKVTLSKKTLELEVGDVYTLTASWEPTDASNTSLEWFSTDSNVARINGGTVRANAVGTTTIRVTAASGVSDTCEVTVKASTSAPVKVTKITILGMDSVETEDAITLVAKVEPEDATNHEVTWSVSDDKIAKINSNGVLTGLSNGNVKVIATAKDGSGVKGEWVVKVGTGEKPEELNKKLLEDAIASAEKVLAAVVTSADGKDVPTTKKWVTAADMTAAEKAVEVANEALEAADEQAEVVAAANALSEAMETFRGKIKPGTQSGGSTTETKKSYVLSGDDLFATLTPNGQDTSETPHPIYNCTAFEKFEKKGTEGFFTVYAGGDKSDGTTGSKIDYSKKTINGTEFLHRINFTGKLTVADGVPSNAIGFKVAENSTVAVKVWWGGSSNDSAGRYMAVWDSTGAEKAKSNEVSTSKNDLFYSELKSFEGSGDFYIGGTPNKSNIFKVEVTVTTSSGGSDTPPAVDTSALDDAIEAAEAAKEAVTVSGDGLDVEPPAKWVTKSVMVDFERAISDAKFAALLASTDAEVTAAVNALNTALAAFNEAAQTGLKPTDKPDQPDNPGGNGGGGGGGGGSVSPSKSDKITDTFLTIDGTVKDKVAVAELTDTQAKTLTSNAVRNSSGNIVVTVKGSDDATASRLNVSAGALKNMADRTDAALSIQTDQGDVKLSAAAVADLGSNSGKNISVIVAKTDDGVKVTVAAGNQILDKVAGGVTAIVEAKGSGSVAYLMQDGRETLLKKSYVEAGMLHVSLPGSGEIALKDNAKTFRDIDGSWAKSAIDFATSRELFNGVNALDFAPNQEMTRSMLVTVLYRLEGKKSNAANKFADVPADSWYTEAVAWANAEGVVSGKSATHFGPDDDITREQLATILYRYAVKLCGMDEVSKDSKALEKFSDQATVSGFAADGMKWAVEQGIIGGRGDGTLAPGGFASRAEVATMLMRFVKTII